MSASPPPITSKMDLCQQLLNTLMAPLNQRLQKELDSLILAANNQTSQNIPCVLINGHCYYHSTAGRKAPMLRSIPSSSLSDSLKDALDTWEKHSFAQRHEQEKHQSYLGSAINISNSPDDLCELLPEIMHARIRNSAKVFSPSYQGDNRNHAKFFAFKKKHAAQLDFIKQRMARNLIEI
mgnify:CR=1 FL=1